MTLTNKIDVYETKKLIHGHGQGQGQNLLICNYTKICFNYKSWTGDWILIILIHMININEYLCPVKLKRISRVQ